MKLSLKSLQTSLRINRQNSLTQNSFTQNSLASGQRSGAIAHRTSRWGTAVLGMMAIASCATLTPSLKAQEAGHSGLGHHGTDRSMDHAPKQPATAQHSGAPDRKMQHGMKHPPLMIPQGQPIPTLNLTVEADAMRGWNLQAAVSNFSFAPERVNQRSLTTEGHAHLFINGEKITRLYGPWYYIPELPPGEHEIRVELNANGHETLMTGGEAIADTVKITVPSN